MTVDANSKPPIHQRKFRIGRMHEMALSEDDICVWRIYKRAIVSAPEERRRIFIQIESRVCMLPQNGRRRHGANFTL